MIIRVIGIQCKNFKERVKLVSLLLGQGYKVEVLEKNFVYAVKELEEI